MDAKQEQYNVSLDGWELKTLLEDVNDRVGFYLSDDHPFDPNNDDPFPPRLARLLALERKLNIPLSLWYERHAFPPVFRSVTPFYGDS